MGGRKRSRKDDDESYSDIMKKLRKLEKKVKKRRRIISSNSESNEEPSIRNDTLDHAEGTEDAQTSEQPCVSCPETPQEGATNDAVDPAQDALDQDILDILGEDPLAENSFGEDLHKDIASRWTYILINGLSKDIKSSLLKNYLPSQNCTQMRPPKLNPEIKAALSEITIKKDIYSVSKQNQLSSCLAALGKALKLALTNNVCPDIIKSISDAENTAT
ncbi:unnamed protein product [Colias eurytheme]|nr:unnamed protein product [Colias eurytheme]